MEKICDRYTDEEFEELQAVRCVLSDGSPLSQDFLKIPAREWLDGFDNHTQRQMLKGLVDAPIENMGLLLNEEHDYLIRAVSLWRIRIGR
jgi:hypothetical protein